MAPGSLKEVSAVVVFIGSVVSGFVWLDSRHDQYGASERSRIQAEIYSLQLTVADLTSTISRYNTLEETGSLSASDRSRRAELITLRAGYIDDIRIRQDRLSGQ